ncbi:MAG TPA: DPP IV N-terminal domain-containing protein, partial [Gemmataceae bacterium]|nr:DPP IV N-terminal domain-containing protein [Gemmataceae bacterium]
MRSIPLRSLLVALPLILAPVALAEQPAPPQTVAEKSGYKATSRHADVVAYCEALKKLSPAVRLDTLGTSFEGRKLPLLIVADPPIATPVQAARSGKTVVLAVGNIHAGEVDGKEALLMLARDLATGKQRALLKDLVVLIVPIFNADGNEKMGKNNRPGQNGPEEAGQRANAQGLDLNRDFVKLESPEVRALVRLLNTWNPAVVIDTHTTNGSRHRYAITYDGPRNPASDDRLVTFVRDTLLPDVGKRMKKNDHLHSFFYGNFSPDRTRWETYPAMPRFGIVYVGLRNRIAILSESYTYAPFRDRVIASRALVGHCLESIAANREKVRAVLSAARTTTIEAGRAPRASDRVVLRFRSAAFKEPATILGFVEETKDGKRVVTDKPKEYRVAFEGRCDPTLSVARPYAYLLPASLVAVTENLQRHGIEVEELREDIELDVEVYRINKVSHALRPFQKHNLASVEATARKETRRVAAGTILVRTAQPLGTLAAYLLEPQADDGLCAWNFFDGHLKADADFPVLRLPSPVPLTSGRVRPLVEGRPQKKPITLDALKAGELPNFNGNPVHGLVWLEDGEHFLQMKEGKMRKVHAVTGRSEPFFDQEKFAKVLAMIPGLSRRAAEFRARATIFQMNPQRTAALIEHQGDFYHCPFDSGKPVRLTKGPGQKELPSFSPDGKWVAFVRDNNLYVVDVATQTPRALTKDGSETVSNGWADWVYFEEIFNRNRHAYWWSPDSRSIAFLHFDDAPVKKFTVVDQGTGPQRLEMTAYPKPGDPNPRVKVGIVNVSGGPIRWTERGKDAEDATLIVRVGWTPDSRQVFYYVQDRAQTWLDFCAVGRDAGAPSVLFRETTKAWVEDPGPPHFLKDGSFLFFSERSGWKHLYHLSGDGKLKQAVTSGEWEVRDLAVVDEENGWVYFSGTRDSPIANNLYRVKLDGTALTRLTSGSSDHAVQVAPKGKLFIDTWSDHRTPPRVQLCRADGSHARTLDTNPVHALDEYEFAKWEFVQIKRPDGFLLEGMVLTPPKLDPKRKYPVWFKTYGGPHMPTVHENWYAGRVDDQALARAGYIVFRCDPRSASGKGACSA